MLYPLLDVQVCARKIAPYTDGMEAVHVLSQKDNTPPAGLSGLIPCGLLQSVTLSTRSLAYTVGILPSHL